MAEMIRMIIYPTKAMIKLVVNIFMLFMNFLSKGKSSIIARIWKAPPQVLNRV